MNSSEDPWKHLVEASKSLPEEPEPGVQPRLSVRSLRTAVHQIALTLTWRKWSLIAAIGTGLVFSIVYFSLKDQETQTSPAIPFEPPSHIDVP